MTRVLRPSALKRLKDTYRDGNVLLPHLQRHVMKTIGDDARPDDHSLLYMHPSDLAKSDWCGRHDWYRIVGTKPDRETRANPSFTMENIFAEGHTIHGKYQTWLWEMGVLFGDWLCLECGHRFGALSPDHCQFCLSPHIIYKELPMRHNRYLIEGHTDAAIHDLDGWSGLAEIKSVGINTLRFEAPRLYQQYQDGVSAEEIWFKINKPFATHLRQGMFYLWMTWPRYEQIVFIYESKFNQRTKEFVVGYNKNVIAPALEVAAEVAKGVRAGVTPDRPLWAVDAMVKGCSGCEYRRTCWNERPTSKADDPAPVRVNRGSPARRKRALRTAPG